MSVISRGDMAELLEFVDAAFDEVALLVFSPAERDIVDPVGFWRDDGCAALILDEIPDPVGIISPVGKQAGALGKVLQEKLGHRRVVHLAGREFELQGKAKLVDAQMQLGGQSSPATADTSISTLFFWAAACW